MAQPTTWDRSPMTPLITGLETAAKLFPNKIAVHYRVWHPQGKNKEVKVDEWKSCTYSEFWERVNTLCNNILKYGARPGDRALIFWIPPSQMDVLALMFGLLKAGIVIVWLDPRTMTFSELLKNIESISPRILFADKLVRWVFRSVQVARGRLKCIKVVIGSKEINGTAKEKPIRQLSEENLGERDMEGGAIMFTTGSTGPPKAVRLTAACLAGQADAYQAAAMRAGLGGPGEFIAIHTGMNFNALDLALGNTTIPLPDPANPGRINPKWIEEADSMFKPSVMTASRIVYENLAAASESRSRKSEPYLPNLRLGFSGGAPVTPTLHERICAALPNLTDFYSAYGCTEGLPLMLSGWHSTYGGSMDSIMVKKSITEGYGVALGSLCSHVEVFLLKLDKAVELDELGKSTKEIQTWNDAWSCGAGEMGELVICSPSVSPFYVNHAVANAMSKFKHASGGPPMHRTGDLVFKDDEGNIWMMGRIAQAVKLKDGIVVPPVCIESLFDGMNGVKRCAFVAVQKSPQTNVIPTLVVLRTKEARKALFDPHIFANKIKSTQKWSQIVTCGLRVIEYVDADEFPMDKRHNSKIRREILSQWALKRI